MRWLFINLFFLATTFSVSENARILGIFHFPSKSHSILGRALLKALAKRGHQVTMISPYPLEKPVENYTDLGLEEMIVYKETHLSKLLKPSNESKYQLGMKFMEHLRKVTEIFWDSSTVQKLLKSGDTYDMVIHSCIMGESILGIGPKVKGINVFFNVAGSNYFSNIFAGNSAPYSYVPQVPVGLSDEMSFKQRLRNTITGLIFDAFTKYHQYYENKRLQHYIPNSPSVDELTRNVSLILANYHYSIDTVRPHLPNIIQVGGLQCSDAQPLPQDLKKYLDNARDGAIFFSLGSNAKLSGLPTNQKDMILRVLGKFAPIRVLLKSDEDLKVPINIKTGKWFPQNDILAHPNIKLFITHGGLLSTTEAVYHAVPLIGLPIFGDQDSNMAETVKLGFSIKLDVKTVTEEEFTSAIKDVIYKPKYKNNVKKRSDLLRDQPVKPIDNAVFWVEHIIRHKGGDHLRSAGLKLYWFQYNLLDVFTCIFLVLGTSFYIIYYVTKKILIFLLSIFKMFMKNKTKTA